MIEKKPRRKQRQGAYQIMLLGVPKMTALKFYQFCYDYELSRVEAFEILLSMLPYNLREMPITKNRPYLNGTKREIAVAKQKYNKQERYKLSEFFKNVALAERRKPGKREALVPRFSAHCHTLGKSPRLEMLKLIKRYLKDKY